VLFRICACVLPLWSDSIVIIAEDP